MKIKMLLFFVLAATTLIAAEGNPKVPADIGVRIRNVQLDQARIQTQMLQLQQQYQSGQERLQHDQGELDQLKKEAFTADKKDPAGWDIDLDKLEFVGKPK